MEISSRKEKEEFRNDEENTSCIHGDEEFRNSKTFEAPEVGMEFDDSRRRRLGDEGDATTLLKMFLKMKECNRDFFYKIENDDESESTNVIWKFKNHKKKHDLREAFISVVYESLTTEEFERVWDKMFKDFDLKGKKWSVEFYEGETTNRLLVNNNAQVVIDKYLLRRWRKDVARSHNKITTGLFGIDGTTQHLSSIRKLEKTFYEATDLVNSNGTLMLFIKKSLNDYLSTPKEMTTGNTSVEMTSNNNETDVVATEVVGTQESIVLKDPTMVTSKGNPKGKGWFLDRSMNPLKQGKK
ncbi:unnamed protein product [Dovyalis caffra]|uniref:Protein FAR1-RELATED SEQUENCE n=1 Tax=Dovyalis caffra TaxID=77055 RepID=A0AAV1R4T3_9ROSI|nr:unnamed protein product [Dovyalis caffra]